jgi:hypothetical protein
MVIGGSVEELVGKIDHIAVDYWCKSSNRGETVREANRCHCNDARRDWGTNEEQIGNRIPKNTVNYREHPIRKSLRSKDGLILYSAGGLAVVG